MVRSTHKLLLISALSIAPAYSGAAQLSTFGQNSLQTATGAAVQTACGGMIAIVTGGGTLTGQTAELFDRCGELVHSGNELADDATTTAKSLSLTADQLGAALQEVAPEETEVMGAGMTDTAQDQLGALQNRLQFLRTGTSTLPIASNDLTGRSGGSAGESDFSRLGVFVNGVYGKGNKDANNPSNGVENGFDFDAHGFTAGLDYRFTDQFIAGVALGYIKSTAEFDVSADDNETSGNTYSVYGSYYKNNFYVEGTAAYGNYDYDATRNINYANNSVSNPSLGQPISRQLRSTTSGDSKAFSLAGGYNINRENQNYSFSMSLQKLDANIDAYTETGAELAMSVAEQEVKSLQTVVSARANLVYGKSYGVLMPFVGLAWHHEFDDEQRSISASYAFDPNSSVLTFTTDAGDTDFATLSLGASLVLASGRQVFVNYDTVLGLANVTSNVITVGVRFEL